MQIRVAAGILPQILTFINACTTVSKYDLNVFGLKRIKFGRKAEPIWGKLTHIYITHKQTLTKDARSSAYPNHLEFEIYECHR